MLYVDTEIYSIFFLLILNIELQKYKFEKKNQNKRNDTTTKLFRSHPNSKKISVN